MYECKQMTLYLDPGIPTRSWNVPKYTHSSLAHYWSPSI